MGRFFSSADPPSTGEFFYSRRPSTSNREECKFVVEFFLSADSTQPNWDYFFRPADLMPEEGFFSSADRRIRLLGCENSALEFVFTPPIIKINTNRNDFRRESVQFGRDKHFNIFSFPPHFINVMTAV